MSAIRIFAILGAVAVSLALQYGLGAPSYVSLPSGVAAYFVIRFSRDARQNLSWKLGYGRGKEGRTWSEPWWVDRKVYALAYMQGKLADMQAKGASKAPSDYERDDMDSEKQRTMFSQGAALRKQQQPEPEESFRAES
jgi:hypothetical protein